MNVQADDPFVKPVCTWNSKTRAVTGWFPGICGTTLFGNETYLLPALTPNVLCRSEEEAMAVWRKAEPIHLADQGWIDRMCGAGVLSKTNELQLYRMATK